MCRSEQTLIHIHTHLVNKCLFNTYYVSATTNKLLELLLLFDKILVIVLKNVVSKYLNVILCFSN